MSLGWKVWEATQQYHKIGNRYPTDTIELGEYEGNSKILKHNLQWSNKLGIYQSDAMHICQTSMGQVEK